MSIAMQTSLETILGDDFENICPLGEDGGLSRLFRAHKRSLDIDVVIKRMRMDPEHPADVQREARVMTGLRHQFLPRIFDLKIGSDGYCYTIMELIPGCTLRQYVQRHGALAQKQMLHWMKQICQAVQYMHSQRPSIIHSDIKPENIMITPQGDICLIDFNASLELRDDGVEAVGATACYAAPEQYHIPLENFGNPARLSPERRLIYEMAVQAQGMGKVTERTDLYAIGATAYFMMTGYDPACWNAQLIPLERYEIVLSEPLRQIIQRCMEKDASRRFSSAKELQKALDNLARLDGRYKAWRRSCQLAALAVGAGLILSGFSAVWGWMTLKRETGEAYNDLILQSQQMAAQRDYEGEQELLLQAIGLDRERPEAYANMGSLLYQMGDYQQAVELLSRLEPDQVGTLSQAEAAKAHGQVQYVLASCYYQMQDYVKAVSCYQLATYFCPEEAAYQRDLAVCYAKAGYGEQARQAIATLEGMDTRPGDVELVSGEIAYAGGEYEKAWELLTQAVHLSEDHTVISRAGLQAAQCCQQLGDNWISREIELLRSVSRRLDAAENGAHIQLLAEAYIRLGSQDPANRESSYRQALEYLEELTARGQATFSVRQNLALVLEYMDCYQEAEETLLALQADYAQDYRPAMRLALLYMDWEGTKSPEQRSYDKAVALYQQAEALYPVSEMDSDMIRLQEMVKQLGGA